MSFNFYITIYYYRNFAILRVKMLCLTRALGWTICAQVKGQQCLKKNRKIQLLTCQHHFYFILKKCEFNFLSLGRAETEVTFGFLISLKQMMTLFAFVIFTKKTSNSLTMPNGITSVKSLAHTMFSDLFPQKTVSY